MGTKKVRPATRVLLNVSTVLALGVLPIPVMAQTAPPPYNNVDEYGVDLSTGAYTFSMTEGVIGGELGGLSLSRTWVGTTWVDNWSGGLYDTSENGVGVTRVEFGGISESFTRSGSAYVPKKGNGATLVETDNGFLYRASDGTEIEFVSKMETDAGMSPVRGPSCRPEDAADCAVPIRRRDPNGITYNLSWDVDQACLVTIGGECTNAIAHYRLASVQSSAGYQMFFSYVSNIQGTGKSGPPVNWRKRSSVAFYNISAPTPLQFSVNYAYPSGDILQLTDQGGGVWQFTVPTTGSGGLTSIRRPGHTTASTAVAYTSGGLTVTQGGVTATYTIGSGTITRTEPGGRTRTVVTDTTIGRPTSDTLAGGGVSLVSSFTYDGSGRIKTITHPELDREEFDYDGRGNQTAHRIVAKPSDPIGTPETTAGYEATCSNVFRCNKPLWTRDARQNQTDYEYDPNHGGLIRVTSPAPQAGGARAEVRISYISQDAGWGAAMLPATASACASATSCPGTAAETVTSTTYGQNFNVSAIAARAGDNSISSTSSFTYDGIGNRLTVDGPLAGSDDTTRYRYDAARRVVGVVSADPDGAGPRRRRVIRTQYDAAGRIIAQQQGSVASQSDSDWAAFSPDLQTTIDYDGNDRPTVQRLIGGGTTYNITQASYDSLGRIDCVAIRMNPAAFGSLPGSACEAQQGSAVDRIGKQIYDGLGRATQLQSAVGTTDQTTEVVEFTPNGKQKNVTDGEGNKTSYEYDGFDRLKITRYPVTSLGAGASSSSDYEQLFYDAAGNVRGRRLRDGATINYGYDNLNRLTSRDRPNTAYWETDHGYAYDLLGRLTGASDSNGRSLSYTYDALGRRKTQSDNWYGYGNASYEYDSAGRRSKMTWGDSMFVTYEYNVLNDMTVIRENGGFTLANFYYDDLGRRASLIRGNGAATWYGYDGASRLSSLGIDPAGAAYDQTISLTYNAADQIEGRTAQNDAYAWRGAVNTDRSYARNGLNQYTSAGGIGFGYDGRGNLNNSGSQTYSYTADNMLATGPSVNLAYDPLGRLFNVNGGALSTTLTYDGTDVLAETNQANGALLRRYVFGPGTDEPLVWYEGSGTSDRRYLMSDERGSVVAATDGNGNAIFINSYDEYGIPSANNQGRFQYTGQKWLPELGMYDYKARIYSPSLGRFMQTDPIGYGDGLNWYNYVRSDPINATDPSGKAQVVDLPDVTACSWYLTTIKIDGHFAGCSSGSGGSFGGAGSSFGQGTSFAWGGGGGAPPPGQDKQQSNCLATNGLPMTCNPPAADPPVRPQVKKYICSKLAAWDYGVSGAFNLAFDERNLKVDGVKVNVKNSVMREGENFLFAARDGVDAFAITLYAAGKLVSQLWEETGPSFAAWRAGMEGRLHYGSTKSQWKEWCGAQ